MIRRMAMVCLFTVMTAQSYGQTSELRNQVAEFARDITKVLKDEKQSQIAIAEFTGPPIPKTSTGPMIQQILIEELRQLKVEINENAFLFVGGNFFVLQQKPDLLEVRINLRIDSKAGKRIDEIVKDIGFRGNDDIVKLLAMNTDQSEIINADRVTVNKHLKKELHDPPVFVREGQVKTGKQSPYGLEMLHRKAGESGMNAELLTPAIKGGLVTVDVPQGNEYIIRLHNGSRYEAAILITIDGVDLFQFYSPIEQRPSMLLVPVGETVEVKGWPVGPKYAKAFLVGYFADGAAHQALKGSSAIGTITASFHPSWQGQPPVQFAGARSSSQIATGLGRDIYQKTEVVNRTIGPLLEAISIRYSK